MITLEFKSAVSSGNLLRARIMLKDSLVVDPTFRQFNEMLAWVRTEAPELIVPHDGEPLEDNSSKWNLELMNLELSQLVGNFSDIRIRHLKQVIAQVMETDIKQLQARSAKSSQLAQNKDPSFHSKCTSEIKKKHALAKMQKAEKKIAEVLEKIEKQKRSEEKSIPTFSQSQIDEIEKAAQNILKEIKTYKER